VSLNEDSAKINIAIEKKSLFILATNDLDEKRLPVSAMLQTYKDQNKTVERGFRFLKNPICLAKSIFLKKQSRIEALGVVMMISLLVYSAIEYSLRKALEQKNETIPDQLKKPTKTPTGRRVFEMFEDVLVVTVRLGDKFHHYINNLTDVLIKILNLLGETYMQKYLII
jgi:transposase